MSERLSNKEELLKEPEIRKLLQLPKISSSLPPLNTPQVELPKDDETAVRSVIGYVQLFSQYSLKCMPSSEFNNPKAVDALLTKLHAFLP